MPNPIPQPLDHRTFLQQFILALASRGVQGMPFDGIPSQVTAYAQDVWEGIEKSVKAAQESRKAEELERALLRKGAVKTSDRLPECGPFGYQTPGRPVDAFSRERLIWERVPADSVTAEAHISFVELR